MQARIQSDRELKELKLKLDSTTTKMENISLKHQMKIINGEQAVYEGKVNNALKALGLDYDNKLFKINKMNLGKTKGDDSKAEANQIKRDKLNLDRKTRRDKQNLGMQKQHSVTRASIEKTMKSMYAAEEEVQSWKPGSPQRKKAAEQRDAFKAMIEEKRSTLPGYKAKEVKKNHHPKLLKRYGTNINATDKQGVSDRKAALGELIKLLRAGDLSPEDIKLYKHIKSKKKAK